jgi:hypothetical protein
MLSKVAKKKVQAELDLIANELDEQGYGDLAQQVDEINDALQHDDITPEVASEELDHVADHAEINELKDARKKKTEDDEKEMKKDKKKDDKKALANGRKSRLGSPAGSKRTLASVLTDEELAAEVAKRQDPAPAPAPEAAELEASDWRARALARRLRN